MLHFAPMKARVQRRLVTRQRFNLLGALFFVTIIPLPLRELLFPGTNTLAPCRRVRTLPPISLSEAMTIAGSAPSCCTTISTSVL